MPSWVFFHYSFSAQRDLRAILEGDMGITSTHDVNSNVMNALMEIVKNMKNIDVESSMYNLLDTRRSGFVSSQEFNQVNVYQN